MTHTCTRTPLQTVVKFTCSLTKKPMHTQKGSKLGTGVAMGVPCPTGDGFYMWQTQTVTILGLSSLYPAIVVNVSWVELCFYKKTVYLLSVISNKITTFN